MNTPLHILHLEDNPLDAEIVRLAFVEAKIESSIIRVESRPEFEAALQNGRLDLVLSDFSLPDFDGFSALDIMRQKFPNIPCILLSGSLDEDVAIESLKRGAMDYILKDRISRLVPAVRRALKETEERIERQKLSEQIIQSQKMEVLGQLAAGVAHDFNNVLGVILGCSELMMQEAISESQRNFAETIRHTAERAAGLTRQLLIFTRKQSEQPVVLDVNKVLEDMNKMLRRLVDDSVKLTIVPGEQIGRIKADAGYVWQVLMNLVINARDAMPQGGMLAVSSHNVTLDSHYASQHKDVIPGKFVMLSVSDTGTGMTDEVKARLFEPFFTTKPKGKGTGLGLATCQTIARQCGAHIGVYSEIGKGTVFKVYFPRMDVPLESTTGHLTAASLPRGTETLLLAEDDPALRDLARAVLIKQGYEVISASHGLDALHMAETRKSAPIHLVITDVVMPEMGGKSMTDSLRLNQPNLKVLFTSGYTADAIAGHGIIEPGISFLAKPYTPGALARKVRDILDA